jgi:hypothetical protein
MKILPGEARLCKKNKNKNDTGAAFNKTYSLLKLLTHETLSSD